MLDVFASVKWFRFFRLASSPAEGGHSAVSGASSLSPHQVNSPVDMIEQQMVKTGLASHHSGTLRPHIEGFEPEWCISTIYHA